MERFVRGVQLLHVQAEVSLPSAGRGAELALEHGLVTRMDLPVGLQRVALGEPKELRQR